MSWGHQQSSWEGEVDGAARWIKRLPKPLGVMAGNDPRGIQLLDACRRAGVAVPEEVAVVGVDNDELVCELAYPPLSSVIPDAARIGYEGAALLHRLMKGEAAPAAMQTIPPQGLAIRQSSDVTAIEDTRLADAMRFIREHACDGSVSTTSWITSRSRGACSRGSSASTSSGPSSTPSPTSASQRVKQLLTETELPLAAIARRAGFTYMEYLSNTFRRQTGWTPSAYRRELAQIRGPDLAPAPARDRPIHDGQSTGPVSHEPDPKTVLCTLAAAPRRGRCGSRGPPDLDHPLQQVGRPARSRHVDLADRLPVLDIDRDGLNDIVIASRLEGATLSWYRREKGSWTIHPIDRGLNIEAGGAAADIDGDGDLDLIFGEDYSGTSLLVGKPVALLPVASLMDPARDRIGGASHAPRPDHRRLRWRRPR